MSEEIAAPANVESSPQWEKVLKDIIPSIVSIRSISVRAFDTEVQRTSQATGFVVDAERGIILTNRHVVQPGPILADAIFNDSKEEVKLIPIYRDPVHDFGFFKFVTSDIKYMKVCEIPLEPLKARVGLEIRVVGNDSGERLSILNGTIARLDRKAPNYGTGKYSDWNTFYLQSASMTSGGSSGSPVIDKEGNAVALNAGGAVQSASSFFLPLDRVVRALKLIQQNEPVARGTIQTIFQFTPYDELRRLGLTETQETYRRTNFKDLTGGLVVEHVLPKGPGSEKLQSGDILLQINGRDIIDFVGLEDMFDSNVGNEVEFSIQRGNEYIQTKVLVQNLESISPSKYVEIGGGVVHELSYHMAKSYMVPFEGVYVASAGYMFSYGGLPRKSVIKSIDNKPITDLDSFIAVMSPLKDGQRVPMQFVQLSDINKLSLSIIQVDRHWHGFSIARRNDVTGFWDYEALPECTGVAEFIPQTARTLELHKSLGPARFVIPSLVQVQVTLPFKMDGIQFQHRMGIGLVLDAKEGFIVVDRKTCPVSIADVMVTFANSIIIPAKIIYLHQLYNYAILQYDPHLLGNTDVKSATISEKPIRQGDEVHLVCLTRTYEPLMRKTVVTNVRHFFVAENTPPSYRAMNEEGVEIENPISQGGVLCTDEGHVQAIHACYVELHGKKETEFYMGMDISIILPVLKGLQTKSLAPMYMLEAELTYIQIAQARVLGLKSDWVDQIEAINPRRNCVMIRRLTSGIPSHDLLEPGDLILSVNGKLCQNFSDITSQMYQDHINLQVLREGAETDLTIPLVEMKIHGTERIVGWAGAIFQMPYKSVYQQLKKVPTGVMCSVVSHGSPAQLYFISPLDWVVAIDEKEITDLDSFLECVSQIPTDTFVRVRTVNHARIEKVVTVRTTTHYFGCWELTRDETCSSGWRLAVKNK